MKLIFCADGGNVIPKVIYDNAINIVPYTYCHVSSICLSAELTGQKRKRFLTDYAVMTKFSFTEKVRTRESSINQASSARNEKNYVSFVEAM